MMGFVVVVCYFCFLFFHSSQYGKPIVPNELRLILGSYPFSRYRVQVQQAPGYAKASHLPEYIGYQALQAYCELMHFQTPHAMSGRTKLGTFHCFLYFSHLPSKLRSQSKMGEEECVSLASPGSRPQDKI